MDGDASKTQPSDEIKSSKNDSEFGSWGNNWNTGGGFEFAGANNGKDQAEDNDELGSGNAWDDPSTKGKKNKRVTQLLPLPRLQMNSNILKLLRL